MNPRLFLSVRTALLITSLSVADARSLGQQTRPSSEAAASQQLPTIEGKWVLTYDYPAGVHKTRIFTLERDKNGRLTGTQDEPACPCDLVVSFKGDKLRMKLTPHRPTRVATPLPPGVILGDPLSTIFESKVTGDTMMGKFYVENVAGESIKFTGVRQTKTEPIANPPKN